MSGGKSGGRAGSDMTEQEWLTCTDLEKMLEFLGEDGTLSERKARLFAVACCRRLWALLDEPCRAALGVAERFAERLMDEEERRSAEEAVDESVALDWTGSGRGEAKSLALDAVGMTVAPWQGDSARLIAQDLAGAAGCEGDGPGEDDPAVIEERTGQRNLLHDLFANPFRPMPPIDPHWRAWHGGTVVRLAQAVYDERGLPSGHLDPTRLAVLADALEEAGCTNADMLGHLRGPGTHALGCWVVDLLLGKN